MNGQNLDTLLELTGLADRPDQKEMGYERSQRWLQEFWLKQLKECFTITGDKEDYGKNRFGEKLGFICIFSFRTLIRLLWQPASENVGKDPFLLNLVLCGIPPTFNQRWSVWPTEYCKGDGLWLPRLHHTNHWVSAWISWSFTLEESSSHALRTLFQAALLRGHVERNWSLPST